MLPADAPADPQLLRSIEYGIVGLVAAPVARIARQAKRRKGVAVNFLFTAADSCGKIEKSPGGVLLQELSPGPEAA